MLPFQKWKLYILLELGIVSIIIPQGLKDLLYPITVL